MRFIPVILQDDHTYTVDEYSIRFESDDYQSVMSDPSFMENFVNEHTGIGLKNGDVLLLTVHDEHFVFVLRDNKFDNLNNAEAQIIAMMINVDEEEEEEDVRL